jgi:hypothetical protein
MSKTLKIMALALLFTGAYTATIDPVMAKKKCTHLCKSECHDSFKGCMELVCESKPEEDQEDCHALCIKQKHYCYTQICKCK